MFSEENYKFDLNLGTKLSIFKQKFSSFNYNIAFVNSER